MKPPLPLLLLALTLTLTLTGTLATTSEPTYDTTTLAGKVASVNNTPGLSLHLSSPVEHEAETTGQTTSPNTPINTTHVLSSPLDGSTVTTPDITVNQDTHAAPQNEPVIAVDPNNPNRLVAAANDYTARTWACTIGPTPCSALSDGYSGAYYSNDGGTTWCCAATGPSNLGTLIPGIERLTGGQYDAGGDPALAFNSRGNIYFAGLGFDRATPPNTVAVSKGSFDTNGNLRWGPPTFIGQTTSHAIFNDKEWIGVDSHSSSPFQGRVYLSWTRFIFNPQNGRYVHSPIVFAYSTDDGNTFSNPRSIVGNVLYDQGSRVVAGPDGTVYVFWEGSTRLATFASVYMAKSTDGGVTWSRPAAIASLVDIIPPATTTFRVNSFPAADIAPDGTLYVAWSSEVSNAATGYSADPACAFFISGTRSVYANCHSASVWSRSTDGGVTWSASALVFPTLDASTRAPVGYPVTQPGGGMLDAPALRRVDTVYPAVAISPSGRVYMSAYAADVVSPWQTCGKPATPTALGRINCLALGNYTDNARLNYVVRDLTTGVTQTVTTNPVNSRYGFGGGFIGDYTDIAVGSDNTFHAIWTDTNNEQTVVWWYGFQFAPTTTNQQDVVTTSGSF